MVLTSAMPSLLRPRACDQTSLQRMSLATDTDAVSLASSDGASLRSTDLAGRTPCHSQSPVGRLLLV